MKQSKAMRIWEIFYPVFLYYAVTLTAVCCLDFILPETADTKLIRQLLTSLAVLPFLYAQVRTEEDAAKAAGGQGFGIKAFFQKQKWNGKRLKILAVMSATGGCFALALNNLLGMLRLAEYSASYAKVEQTFYTGRLALEILALCIVIPVIEELLYRGIVYKRAKDWLGFYPACVMSAVLFGLVHMNLVQFVYAAVFGLLLAYFAELSGGVEGAVFAHMAANLTSVLRAETDVFAFMEQKGAVWIMATAVLSVLAAGGILYAQARTEE